jgi:phosphomannomutase
MTTPELTCFKAYDVRGRIPDELNPDIAYRIGRAYAAVVKPRRVVVGHDIRLSSEQICAALVEGLRDAGYRRARHRSVRHRGDLLRHLRPGRRRRHHGHRQPQPQGLQRHEVRARGFAPDQQRLGPARIKALAEKNALPPAPPRGSVQRSIARARYVIAPARLCGSRALKPLKIVVNAGNGGAGAVVDRARAAPAVRVHQGAPRARRQLPERRAEPDARGEPQAHHRGDRRTRPTWARLGRRLRPLLLLRRERRFIEGYYLVGLLAAALERDPGERIVHDPRLTWNTMDIVSGSAACRCCARPGHAFIKQRCARSTRSTAAR